MYFTGTEICYPVLDQNSRFKDGLGKIAKSIVERLSAPRIVTVAGESRELNATNAESIIATIISEANKGKIDLVSSFCQSIFRSLLELQSLINILFC